MTQNIFTHAIYLRT